MKREASAIKKENPGSRDVDNTFQQLLLDRYVPLCIIVDADLNLLHVQGDPDNFFQFPFDAPDFNLNKIADAETLKLLTGEIDKVKASGRLQFLRKVKFNNKDQELFADLHIDSLPADAESEKVFLIEFKPSDENLPQAEKRAGVESNNPEIVEAAKNFEAIFKASEDYFSILSLEGKLLDINAVPEGYDINQIIGTDFFQDIIPEPARPVAKAAFDECINTMEVVKYSLPIAMPNGRTHFYLNAMVPIIRDHQAERVICVSRDQTVFWEIEKEVQIKASIFNKVFQHAREHILILTPEGIIVDINFTDAGFTKSELIGKDLISASLPPVREQIRKELTKIQQGEQLTIYETEFDAPNGKHYWYHNILSPVINKGRLERIILISRDITSARLSEISLKEDNLLLEERVNNRNRELALKNSELEEVNSFMDSFVHGAAHDLRSPLLNIKGFVELLPLVESPDERQSIFRELNSASRRMEQILAGLVELIEFQRSEGPKPKVILLRELIEQTLADLESYLNKHNGHITLEIPPDLTICYIEAYLQSIIYNLLHNAIKYRSLHRPLSINIAVREEPAGFVQIIVKDNGMGMDLERYGHLLFKPFRRLTVEREGIGIGLSIINKVAKKNGGYIEVESKLDSGTTFRVYLKPYQPAA